MLRLLPSACRTIYIVRMRSNGATDALDTMPATPPAISLQIDQQSLSHLACLTKLQSVRHQLHVQLQKEPATPGVTIQGCRRH